MFSQKKIQWLTSFCFLLVFSLLLTGCVSSSLNTITLEKKTNNKHFYSQTKKPKYTLDIWINDKDVKILGVEPYDAMNKGLKPVSDKTPNSLKWVLKSNSGKLIAKGYVRDPRVAQVVPGKNSHKSSRFKEKTANFRLDVPTNKGTLFLYNNPQPFKN